MEPYTQSDELSLRDLYLVLKRRRNLILGLTLGAAIVVFAASLVWPKTYSSKVTVSLSLSTQQLSSQPLTSQLLANLPSITGLAGGFGDLLETSSLTQTLGVTQPTRVYRARFDEKKGLWNLMAKGRTPAEAKQNAQKLLRVAQDYVRSRIVETVGQNLEAVLAQARQDQRVAQESLRRLQEELKKTPRNGASDAAALEAQGTSPLVARSTSPAYTLLSMEESRTRAALAQAQARIEALTAIQANEEELSKLVGQALQAQVLVPPAEPLRPVSPRPLLYTAIAGVLGLLVGVFWAFLAEALAPPQVEAVRQRDTQVVVGSK